MRESLSFLVQSCEPGATTSCNCDLRGISTCAAHHMPQPLPVCAWLCGAMLQVLQAVIWQHRVVEQFQGKAKQPEISHNDVLRSSPMCVFALGRAEENPFLGETGQKGDFSTAFTCAQNEVSQTTFHLTEVQSRNDSSFLSTSAPCLTFHFALKTTL